MDTKLRHHSNSDTSHSDVDSVVSDKSWPDWGDTPITSEQEIKINTQIEHIMSDLEESMDSTLEGENQSQSILNHPISTQPSVFPCHQPV